MSRLELSCHPACAAPTGVAVSAGATWLPDGRLQFDYAIADPNRLLMVPAPSAPVATDGLWQHTCCEAFLTDRNGYREFNFSPSSAWAAYAFDDYRQRGPDLELPTVPDIRFSIFGQNFRLTAELPLAAIPGQLELAVSLTVVLETLAGDKSYWALAHAAPQPDFHLRESFTLALNRP